MGTSRQAGWKEVSSLYFFHHPKKEEVKKLMHKFFSHFFFLPSHSLHSVGLMCSLVRHNHEAHTRWLSVSRREDDRKLAQSGTHSISFGIKHRITGFGWLWGALNLNQASPYVRSFRRKKNCQNVSTQVQCLCPLAQGLKLYHTASL